MVGEEARRGDGMSEPTIKATGRLIRAELPNGQVRLIGELSIDCPYCGGGTISIPGHHMQLVRNFLIEWIDAEPALTQATVVETGRDAFSSTRPPHPEQN